MDMSKNKENSLPQVANTHLGIAPGFNLYRFCFSSNVTGNHFLTLLLPNMFPLSLAGYSIGDNIPPTFILPAYIPEQKDCAS